MPPSSTPFHQGGHVNLTDRSTLPFQCIENLGTGGSATVEVVQDKTTGSKFAHKVLRPRRGTNHEFEQAFRNEIDIIKRLHSHPHIIQVYWSYICDDTFGMLLTPVASDGDLKAYLQTIQSMEKPLSSEHYSVLGRSFGCLASGLAFIHSHTIRHKDIKPQNILVHEGQMIITDFGIALDASGQDTTTTTGMAEGFTDRYRAPEVARCEPRNRMSDVFSLGCVFLEIMASLAPDADVRIATPTPYWARVDDVQDNLIHLSDSNFGLHKICLILSSMLQLRSTDRVEAEAVVHRLRSIKISQSEPSYELICGTCAMYAPSTSQDSTDETIAISDIILGPSDGEEHERVEDTPIFSLYRPRYYGIYLTTQAAIEDVANRPLSPAERHAGYIYIFQHPHNPNFIKCGYTRDVPRRIKQWRQHCKSHIVEYDQGERVLIPNAARVERLVMAHLRDVRFEEKCIGCHMRHLEWFRATPEDAARIVKKYSDGQKVS
jgi:serine/threonine protein kinase